MGRSDALIVVVEVVEVQVDSSLRQQSAVFRRTLRYIENPRNTSSEILTG